MSLSTFFYLLESRYLWQKERNKNNLRTLNQEWLIISQRIIFAFSAYRKKNCISSQLNSIISKTARRKSETTEAVVRPSEKKGRGRYTSHKRKTSPSQRRGMQKASFRGLEGPRRRPGTAEAEEGGESSRTLDRITTGNNDGRGQGRTTRR